MPEKGAERREEMQALLEENKGKPHIGMNLHNHVIVGPVKKGGMGEVYLAYDERLNQKVAIKVVEKAVNKAKDDGEERFVREANILARLKHPAIPHVQFLEETETHYYLATEFIEGQTLHGYLNENVDEVQKLSFQRALLPGFLQIADALALAHSEGIIHRDIKPENIMILINGELKMKLIDFGVAKEMKRKRITEQNAICGTIGYLSPEQIFDVLNVDKRTDIYSLGMVLYELFTCQNFIDETFSNDLALYVVKDKEYTDGQMMALPFRQRGFIALCMDIKPHNRFGGMHEFKGALKLLMRQMRLEDEEKFKRGTPQEELKVLIDLVDKEKLEGNLEFMGALRLYESQLAFLETSEAAKEVIYNPRPSFLRRRHEAPTVGDESMLPKEKPSNPRWKLYSILSLAGLLLVSAVVVLFSRSCGKAKKPPKAETSSKPETPIVISTKEESKPLKFPKKGAIPENSFVAKLYLQEAAWCKANDPKNYKYTKKPWLLVKCLKERAYKMNKEGYAEVAVIFLHEVRCRFCFYERTVSSGVLKAFCNQLKKASDRIMYPLPGLITKPLLKRIEQRQPLLQRFRNEYKLRIKKRLEGK